MTRRSLPVRFLRRSWDTVLVAVSVTACLVASWPLSNVAAWIPRIVLAIVFALVVAQLVIEFRELGPASDGQAQARLPPIRPTGPVVVVLWIAALMLAVLLFGTVAGSTLFCAAYLRWHAREPWRTSCGVAVALGISVQLIFSLLLRAQLHPGWLWQMAQ